MPPGILAIEGLEIVAKKRVKRREGEKIDFEAALVELEEIVHILEDGEIGLSDSLGRYEKGVKLLRQCYGMLDGAQRRIEVLTGKVDSVIASHEPEELSELTEHEDLDTENDPTSRKED